MASFKYQISKKSFLDMRLQKEKVHPKIMLATNPNNTKKKKKNLEMKRQTFLSSDRILVTI
jgi:hypothetical protein